MQTLEEKISEYVQPNELEKIYTDDPVRAFEEVAKRIHATVPWDPNLPRRSNMRMLEWFRVMIDEAALRVMDMNARKGRV